MTRTVRTTGRGAAVLAAFAGSAAFAQVPKGPAPRGCARLSEIPLRSGGNRVMPVTPRGPGIPWNPGFTDDCNMVSTYTDSSFANGQYLVEAGLGEGEWAACVYTLPASAFPVKLVMAEILFGQQNAVSTTTQWSVGVWSGNPRTGAQVFLEAADDVILPYIRIPAGTNGVDVQFSVDPQDPDQIIINDDGSHQVSIGFRVDRHNAQTQNPCSAAPPSNQNAFPMVDTSGLSNPSGNWLYGLNCNLGSFNCPPAYAPTNAPGFWGPFSSMNAFCRPTGDWCMRMTWASVSCTPGVGACCKPDGSCEVTTTALCTSASGTYQGDATTCAQITCPQPTGGCCFDNGNCLTQSSSACAGLGGHWLGAGINCNGSLCPTTGGCCLANGSCTAGLTSAQCVAQNGVFRGLGTTCAGANCPVLTGACCTNGGANCGLLSPSDCSTIGGVFQGAGTTCSACTPPSGACCTNGGANCGILTQANCSVAGGSWQGANTTCAATCTPTCYANCDQSTTVPFLNVNDFSCFLNSFASGSTYANCDHSTTAPVLNVNDFSCFLNKFATGCSAP